MISIIVSSVNQSQLAAVRANVAEIIGVPYELIAIDNSKGEWGICEVYNRGAAQSKFDILCFMHEDVKINTMNWGGKVADAFVQHPGFGLIGIAGSQYKSLAPSGWHCYDIEAPDIQYYQLVQHFKFSDQEPSLAYANPRELKLARVGCIDGVWFCCTREAYSAYQFDEQMLKGFHGYDLDFSMGINQTHQVGVTFEVLIEHFSEGKFDEKWLREILKVHAKWSRMLPLNIAGLPKEQLLVEEKRAFRNIFKRMISSGFKPKELFAVLRHSMASPLMTVGLATKLYFYIVKLVLRKP
ncbi:MAG: glycosyltransferase [Pedobacter sp.]|nr:glycosyltransferase [Pedobacter sp.]MDQ8052711.1 glycosyltransferase [Pedobacter sp.]